MEINRRNAAAVQQTLTGFSEKLNEQQVVVEGLLTMIRSMAERMIILEKMVLQQKAVSFGTGPSVK
jgi:uncharacterized coiled-coil protein SlyX